MNRSEAILIKRNEKVDRVSIELSSSKSESNRALIINAFTGNKSRLERISDARDTQIMQKLLNSSEQELNVMDAGTTMRFLTAYFAVRNEHKILTGTPRMNERPIKILVEALRMLGAEINYLGREGYPPLEIKGLREQKTDSIHIRGDISSQYISALLMIAPVLPKGLTLTIEEPVNSRPYIEMTLSLMARFGIQYSRPGDNIYSIGQQEYLPTEFSVESDWSGASYWYSIVALSKAGTLHLKGLKKNSLQGDHVIEMIMADLGVESKYDDQGVWITQKPLASNNLSFDFSDCPDLAQTVAVACAAKGIHCRMSGLESLRIKETDRILALQNELAKIGARLDEQDKTWLLIPSVRETWPKQPVRIKTYDDHRMALSFAPLATLTDLVIEDPAVVQKSYPHFWEDMKSAGFPIVRL